VDIENPPKKRQGRDGFSTHFTPTLLPDQTNGLPPQGLLSARFTGLCIPQQERPGEEAITPSGFRLEASVRQIWYQGKAGPRRCRTTSPNT
jgi:hypothetical protein